jgi:hypothetical protein
MYRPFKLLVLVLVAAAVMATIDGNAHARRGVGVHQIWRRDLGR